MASSDIRAKNQAFYIPIANRPPTDRCRWLLTQYSKVPAENVDQHITKVRDHAWEHYPYPSIGLFVFLDLGLSGDDLPDSGPAYPEDSQAKRLTENNYNAIVSKLQGGGKFLDVGCMFAQDTRKLVADGAPPFAVFGTDLHGEYFDYGYELFQDQETIPRDHFIACDILDSSSPALSTLTGNLDVVNATHILHVFSIEDQLLLLKRFVKLLKDEPGVQVTGRMTGHDDAGYHMPSNAKATTKTGGAIWEHTPDSFRELWGNVMKETGTKWDVKCWMWKFGTHTALEGRKDWFRSKENGICTFIVTRLE